VTVIKGLEHTIVEIMSGIAFPGIGNHFFVTGKSAGARNEFKNITLGELLKRAEPPVKLEDILEIGALISVSFFWNCDVSVLDCEPGVVIKHLDGGKGFSQKRAMHNKQGRDAVLMYGIRILVESSGIGRKMSFVLFVIQVGSALALLRTASMAADSMMLYLYPRHRREAYYKCKVLETADFSDLQDRLNLVRESQEEGDPLLQQFRDNSEPPPTGTSLSPGPGGKGGIASNLLRPTK
jgi:hypothetical protein